MTLYTYTDSEKQCVRDIDRAYLADVAKFMQEEYSLDAIRETRLCAELVPILRAYAEREITEALSAQREIAEALSEATGKLLRAEGTIRDLKQQLNAATSELRSSTTTLRALQDELVQAWSLATEQVRQMKREEGP